jgi:hypothetical protein
MELSIAVLKPEIMSVDVVAERGFTGRPAQLAGIIEGGSGRRNTRPASYGIRRKPERG